MLVPANHLRRLLKHLWGYESQKQIKFKYNKIFIAAVVLYLGKQKSKINIWALVNWSPL